MPEKYRIDRASDADLAFLATDRDAVPQQVAVVLLLDPPVPEDTCVRLLGDRTAAVPRLRQRLIGTPPVRRPPVRSLAADAWRSRAAAWRTMPARLRRLRTAMAAGGGIAPAAVPPCSLLHATGALRRAVVIRVGSDALRDAAHRRDAGLHAALLTAVAGALRVVLDGRGETIGAVTIAVPAGTPAPRPGGGAVRDRRRAAVNNDGRRPGPGRAGRLRWQRGGPSAHPVRSTVEVWPG
ncbi:hypothetical protein ACFQFC_01830 [Amorphoplanes digitatis]|uniref:Uncharacterized protein n=1 Tax=Actinoplanes digitatis TaxID=1868 RepID=A0A7W7HY65_9ACTN|nr:hypothetical protein [Actinoplanes digitatis]MBB4762916.1 hypothetical protein [Actinoplanes digitatis]GID91589.1 hypothetical protein Adi01nite_10010 [Actinoplanes digitatis]